MMHWIRRAMLRLEDSGMFIDELTLYQYLQLLSPGFIKNPYDENHIPG